MTLFELVTIVSMYSNYFYMPQYYYFYLVHSRLKPVSYTSYIEPVNPIAPCPIYPEYEKSESRLAYKSITILEMGKLKNIRSNDITNVTQIYDPVFPNNSIVNNTQIGSKFYNFEMQIPGNDTVELLTNYQFNIWKGVKMCVLPIYLTNPDAIILIPKVDKCNVFLGN